MDFSALTATISTTISLAKALVEERDGNKTAAIKADLTDKIIQLQSQLMEVVSTMTSKDTQIHELTERVRQLEATKAERDRYQLVVLGERGDLFAYQLRPASELSERADEPSHKLCQLCFDKGQKAVLQGTNGGNTLACPNDARHFLVLKRPQISTGQRSPAPRL